MPWNLILGTYGGIFRQRRKKIIRKLTSKPVSLQILRVRPSQEHAQQRQETSESLHDQTAKKKLKKTRKTQGEGR